MTVRKGKSIQVGKVESLFLDSGAFTLYFKQFKRDPGFYQSDRFWTFVDDYASFVKKYADVIDHYANVDVLYDPELSWKVLKYLEDEHGLHPVPVLHYGASHKWLDRHLKAGYGYIGLGGLGTVDKMSYQQWADGMFLAICPPPTRLPTVKVHGFAMTSNRILFRYPWFSVDSATWVKVGAYGGILMPRRRRGRYIFTERPVVVKLSDESPDAKLQGRHYTTMTGAEREVVRDWLGVIGVPLGDGEDGVINCHATRRKACLLYFEELKKHIPEWPWPFRPPLTRRTLGVL